MFYCSVKNICDIEFKLRTLILQLNQKSQGKKAAVV